MYKSPICEIPEKVITIALPPGCLQLSPSVWVYKVRMMAHFAPKDLTHLLLMHVTFSFSL